MTVMRNAIAPAFADLFSDQEPILTQKTSPPTLAYSSTPFRGLRLLLDAFPHIRQAVPGARLRVFSSMKVYLKSAEEDEAAYGALYQRCREMEGVEYIGSLPQAELARELRSAAILAYPNTFAETSCINVMEAMAAGCTVITSRLAALPETGAGYARLIAVEEGEEAYLHGFITETIHALRSFTAREPALELELGRQVAAMNQTATWPVRAREWIRWLETLAVERRAASATSQALALAFQHHQAGRLQAAENIYRQILQTNPAQPDALNLLGLVAHATGQHGTAIQLIGQAVASEPTAPQFHYNLAKIYRALDRLPDAIACYQRTLALKPDFAAAHHNLGNAFRAQGNLAEAAACYRRALEIKADFPQAAHNLRLALETLERKV
jgi:tetratricopeptide (TPR) repeat protein